jgi:hypothetical protein
MPGLRWTFPVLLAFLFVTSSTATVAAPDGDGRDRSGRSGDRDGGRDRDDRDRDDRDDDDHDDDDDEMEDLIRHGSRLFRRETFGGNGRTCQSCHTSSTGTINPLQISLLPVDDPIFQHDAADTLGGSTFNRVQQNATFLVNVALPENIRIVGSDDRSVLLPRGVPTIHNTAALDPVLMWDGRAPTLQIQAFEAWLGHSQITELPTDYDLDAVAAFQQTQVTIPQLRKFLEEGRTPKLPRPRTAQQRRGMLFFTDDNPANGNPIKGRCVHCHGGPMLNATTPGTEMIFGIPTGTRFISAFVSEFELGGGTPITYEVTNPDSSVTEITTTDPGRMLITGDPIDASAFKIPTIWGFRNTAPYFHNNSAANIDELMDHYQEYFNFVENVLGIQGFGMTDADKEDIKAYLRLF